MFQPANLPVISNLLSMARLWTKISANKNVYNMLCMKKFNLGDAFTVSFIYYNTCFIIYFW